jgi:hypothetical protein
MNLNSSLTSWHSRKEMAVAADVEVRMALLCDQMRHLEGVRRE